MTPCRCPHTPGRPARDKLHGSYCEQGRKAEAKTIPYEPPVPRKWR